MRYLSGFVRFWRNFLIGDSPVLFLGTVLTLLVVAFSANEGIAGVIAFPALVMATVVVSLSRGRN